jgi:MoaA/NifB/PqqE/SkfB family radical SAM enzyme
LAKQFRLQGLSFKSELMGHTINYAGETVYLSLVPWEFCNWACLYCHEGWRRKETDELSLDEMRSIIREAGEMRIRSLLLLGGEILLVNTWAITKEIVREAYEAGLVTLIYTNGSQLTLDMAKYLADHKVSLAFKLDSLSEDKYDRMAGQPGSFKSTMRAIDIARKTSIGDIVYESEKEQLVRLLFTTVGSALNVDEYVSLARFATNHGARWMMESLNHRGDAQQHPELALNVNEHSEAMRVAMLLNPEQQHEFHLPCRLFSCITIRKKGEVAVCPQDYNFIGNIREIGSLRASAALIKDRVQAAQWREGWTGQCPVKASHFYSA